MRGPAAVGAVLNRARACAACDRQPAARAVFDVDIEDGAPPKKLALNRGQNPYDVADTFLMDNNLPTTYRCMRGMRASPGAAQCAGQPCPVPPPAAPSPGAAPPPSRREQIVGFILQNTGMDAPPMPTSYDPYTGGSAYVPGGSSRTAGGAASLGVTGGGADPFTGGGAAVVARHVPASAVLVYDQVGADAPSRTQRVSGGACLSWRAARAYGCHAKQGAPPRPCRRSRRRWRACARRCWS